MEARALRASYEVRVRSNFPARRKLAVKQFKMAATEVLAVHGHRGRHAAIPLWARCGSARAGPCRPVPALRPARR